MKKDEELDRYFYIAGWMMIGLAVLLIGIVWRYPQLLAKKPPCVFHEMTGYYCPGCGGTRAVIAFLQGRWLKSVFYHPFVLYTVVIGGWFMLSQTVERISGHRLAIGMHCRAVYLWVAVLLIFLNCLIKNGVRYVLHISLI